MTLQQHIIIIGAGLSGLSVADCLMHHGQRVSVFDIKSGPAQGASYSNSGMIHPSQAMPWNWNDLNEEEYLKATNAVYNLAVISNQKIKSRMAELGLEDYNRPVGSYKVFDVSYTQRKFENWYRKLGIPFTIERATEGFLNGRTICFPKDFSGDAYVYCTALEKALRANGANISYNCDKISLKLRDQQVIGIILDGETILSDHVVLACGMGASHFLNPLKIDIGLYADRGFAVNYSKPDISLPKLPIMHHESNSALTVFNNHIRFSGTRGQSNEKFLIETWRSLFPDIFEVLGEPLRVWSEDRPMSSLGRPYIGQTSVNKLWVNAGHGHMGWSLSAGAGSLLSKMIVTGLEDHRFEVPPSDKIRLPFKPHHVNCKPSNKDMPLLERGYSLENIHE